MIKNIALLFLVCCSFLYSQTTKEWMWEIPFPHGNTLRSVHGSSSNDIFAVGDFGTIIHYDGRRWHSLISNTINNLRGVWANSPSDVFAVGRNVILHYDGELWSVTNFPKAEFSAVWGTSPNDVFASGGNQILHYDGNQWTKMNTPNILGSYIALWGTASDNVFAGGGPPGIMLHYNGNEWTTIDCPTSESIRKIHGVENRDENNGNDDIFAVTINGKMLHFDGTQWNNMLSPPAAIDGKINNIWVYSKTDIYAVGTNGKIFYYNGKTWIAMKAPKIQKDFLGMWGSDRDNILAIGENGTIFHFDSLTWVAIGFGISTQSIQGIWGSSENDIFVVGDQKDILHYDGEQWTSMTSPASTIGNLHAVSGRSANDVYAVGSRIIMRYNGSTWVKMPVSTIFTFHSVWVDENSSDVFAVGEMGTIFHFNGTKWEKMSSPIQDKTLYAVWGSSKNNVYAGGPFSGILHYNGDSWKIVNTFVPGTIKSIWGTSANDVFAVGENGKIRHFDGNSWSEMVSPSEKLLEGVWGSSSDNVFAVGDNSTILHYNGDSWVDMKFSSNVWFLGVWGSTADDVLIVGSGSSGTVLHLIEPTLVAPNKLRAFVPSVEEIILDWQDNAIGEDGFIIERKSEGREDFEEVGTVDRNVLQFTDNNVEPLTTYFYRLKSFSSEGESKYSNVKSVVAAVGEMMCVNLFRGSINKDQISSSINIDLSLNNFPDSFIPRQDILQITLTDNTGKSYNLTLVQSDFVKSGTVPGVFTLKNTAKGISGTLQMNIGGSSKTNIKINALKVPISLSRAAENYPLNIALQWGNFNDAADVIAIKNGLNFNYSRATNTQLTEGLYFDHIKANINLTKENLDSLEFKAYFPPGAGRDYTLAAPIKISIGGFYFELSATLEQSEHIITGNVAFENNGRGNILIDLKKNTLLFKATGVNLTNALEETIITSLEIGSFSKTRVVTLTKKETKTAINFLYK